MTTPSARAFDIYGPRQYTKEQVAHLIHLMILKAKPHIIRKRSWPGRSCGMRRLGLFKRPLTRADKSLSEEQKKKEEAEVKKLMIGV
jgi:hypothetical protein